MKIIVHFIIAILLILIAIGDGVLFVVSFFKKYIDLYYQKTCSVLKQVKNTFRNLPFKKVESYIHGNIYPASPHTPRLEKRIKEKPYTVFSPFSFITKVKYFFAGAIFSFIFLFLPLIVFTFLQDLPDPKAITLGQIPQTTKIYDRKGILLYQIYASQNRTLVPLEDIPTHLQNATIAIEDKGFYRHPGFDVSAIIRSAVENLSGHNLQGGSTITQQLIKSSLLSPETSYKRKIKEVVLAFWAERLYSKQQILELYFNYIPYGSTAWGAEAASRLYFNKHVKDLDLAESAFLAGIPKAPTNYSPFGSTPNLWKKRQKEVLQRMVELGFITKEEAEIADNKDLVFQQAPNPLRAPHFVMYVKDYLVQKYGLPAVEKGGLSVITSLDLSLQENVQQIVTDEVNRNEYLQLSNGASLVTNPKNGDILAMVGSKDFSDSKSGNVNLTTSLRQPGSSVKVITYSAALTKGMTAATILEDTPVTYNIAGSQPYIPVNYDGKFHGRVPLRIALANSFNIPAVKTLNTIGVPTMIDFAKRMGITTWNHNNLYGLSLTLGAAEAKMTDMATVYGTLANNGIRVDLNPIIKITDYKGNILEEKPEKVIGKTVLDNGVTFIISNILADNQARAWEFGTNSPLVIPNKTVSVKTGTSDNKRDNWTIGYTPSFVVAAWVGNNDNTPMSQNLASGITGAAPIWNRVMSLLLTNKPDEKPVMPNNVVTKPCVGRIEYFLKGTENSINCSYRLFTTPSVSPSPRP